MYRILPVLIFIVFSFSYHASAQHELYNDGAILHANKNSIIHVNGEIENKAGSRTQNDGVIEMTGDLTNDSMAAMTNGIDSSSTERVYKFIGAGKQSVKGNFADTTSRYLYNIVIDKAAASSAVELRSNTYIKGSLVFGSATAGAATYTASAAATLTNNGNHGIIKTYDSLNNDYEIYVTNPAVNAVAGYAPLIIDAAPVDGFISNRGLHGVGRGGLARNVSQTGIPYVFPIGSALNGYNAAAITFTSIRSALDKVRGLFVDATGGVGFVGKSCNACGSTPYALGFNYFIKKNPCNGNLPKWLVLNVLPTDHGYWSYSGDSADVYSVEMYPNSLTGGAPSTTWRAIKKSGDISSIPDDDWSSDILATISSPLDLLTYTTETGCYIGSGIPGGLYTGFGSYQLLRSAAGSSLPIKLISLSATTVGDKYIRLAWSTAQEIDNKGFQVMRSENGTGFIPTGWMDARGNGNAASGFEYTFDDHTALPGITYYYRLDQADIDGTVVPTYVVDARIGGEEAFSVSDFYPNPAASQSQILIHAPVQAAFVAELYTVTGQLIETAQIAATPGDTRYALSTDKLPSGTYKVVIKNDLNLYVKSLNIIR